jgi:hypothetical protein
MLTLLMTGFALFVIWAIGVYIVRPILEDTGLLAAAPDPDHSVKSAPVVLDPDPAPAIVPAPRSEAVPATLGTPVPEPAERAPEDTEPLRLTKEDVVRALAEVEILAADGTAHPISVKAIARLVGMRDQDVSAIVKEVRGEKPAPPKPPAPFEELTKDGRRVATHLRARAS